MQAAQDVLTFWFKETGPEQKFKKDTDFDILIAKKFTSLHLQATHCELSFWRETAEGRLAEIIILDQFSRNLFRNKPDAFASDSLALGLAQEAVRVGADQSFSDVEQRMFLYMPFMHSESLAIHEKAVSLFSQEGMELTLDFEWRHKRIIERFGRYPHRNATLGRRSTKEEIDFLKELDSSF